MTERAQLSGASRQFSFVTAGRATFTLQSKRTGERFTYRVCAPQKDGRLDTEANVRFVKVLTGSDNESDYQYAGFFRVDDFVFRHGGAKARIGVTAPSVKAIEWFLRNLGSTLVEVWHEGSCGRCGRTLTVPESIEIGLGPICMGRAS